MWDDSEFFEYTPDMNLDDLPEDRVCLLQMRHLRQLDTFIPRGLSYERTVYMFFVSMELDERLRVFKKLKNVVVLLDRQGALCKKNGKWAVIFAPKETEGLSIDPYEPLFPIFDDMRKRARAAEEMTTLPLDDITIRALISGRVHINFLDTYCNNYPGGYLAVAQNIVVNGTKELFSKVPVCTYGALTTVDFGEMESFHTIKALLDDYMLQVTLANNRQVKPLTIAVFGAPGSGKSFGIKQMAKSSGSFETFTLNLSQFKDYDDMAEALYQAINGDQNMVPLIFFDEFDSDYQGTARGWLKYLLAPMQDGEFNYKGKTTSIQKAVFVFAGGTASSFEEFLPSTDEEKEVFKKIKGPDFISRLKGTLSIKGPNATSITDNSYIIRRALLLRDLIVRKVPSIYDRETEKVNISRGLLSALLRVSTYKHGTRSIEFILDMSRLTGVDKFSTSCLPQRDQLSIHLDSMDFFKKLSSNRINEETFEHFCEDVHKTRTRLALDKAKGNPTLVKKLKKQPLYQPWESLSETYRNTYRVKLRSMLENMSATYFPLGIRPKSAKRRKDFVKKMTKEELCLYAKLDYGEWLHHQKSLGWIYGEVLDEEVKISPAIKEWDQLTKEQQEDYMEKISILPEYLERAGMELYRKPF